MDRNTLKNKKIAVLLGGCSAEREISLKTGRAVLDALHQNGYPVVAIDAGRNVAASLFEEKIEVAFIALHGRFGEDGTVQGLLEMMRIPYTGSGVLASSLAMDKLMSKKIFSCHGIPTPEYRTFRRGDDPSAFQRELGAWLPVVVKPSCEGSTLGVSIIKEASALERGLEDAFRYDEQVLVEKFISGREITVSILNGRALPVIEIQPKNGFYDFRAKYTSGQTKYLLPAPLEENLYCRIQEIASRAYGALQCDGAARVDFMIQGEKVFCLEVNTIPGMTETSLLPKAAAHAGIPFPELVLQMLEGASLKV